MVTPLLDGAEVDLVNDRSGFAMSALLFRVWAYALALAILKTPSIFLFDEATSVLDSRPKKEIQHSLDLGSKGETTLVIVNRLSTIMDADEIIVLCDDKIAERGTHLQLLNKSGLYAQMWTRQSSGFSDKVGDDNVMIN